MNDCSGVWCGWELDGADMTGHGFHVNVGSHSWHAHPSISLICSFDMCVGRHCECIHRRHRSNCIKLRSPESSSPRR